MLKINQKTKNNFDYLFSKSGKLIILLKLVTLVILFNRINIIYRANTNLVEVSLTPAEINI